MQPLQGIRFTDFMIHAAGPFCGHLLSLMGAECIKIESALRLDNFRKPHPVYGRMEPATFSQVASNKLSIALNLKKPEGIELAKRLVGVSDVVGECFRPGVMERLGLGYQALKAVKEDIVMVSVSACGQTGPEREYAGYAPLFGATGGVGMLTGYEDGPPTEVRHVMDHSVGLNAAAATLAALYRRKQTGLGQHVDIAAREVASAFVGDALLQYAMTGVSPGRHGNDAPLMAPHNVYPCTGTDAWVSIAVDSEAAWLALVEILDRSDWRTDGRFATQQSRWENRHELDRVVGQWTRTRTREAVTEILQARGVAAFPSYTSQDIADDVHLQQRGAILDMAGPDGKWRKVVGAPWLFEKTPASFEKGTPQFGEHNEYVYGELLGLTQAQIGAYVDKQVIY